MSLTDAKIRKIRASEKQYKIFDREGLFLLVKPSGSKIWKYKYHFGGKERLLTIGNYPEISLLQARNNQFEAKKNLMQNIDPSQLQRESKQKLKFKVANTFKSAVDLWHQNNSHKWLPHHAEDIKQRLENHVLPALGSRQLDTIKPMDILHLLKPIEKRGNCETVHKLLGYIRSTFQFAVIAGLVQTNPARELSIAFKQPLVKNHLTIKAAELPAFLKELETVNTSIKNKIAVKLLLATMLRTGELRKSKWEYINFETREWIVPAEIMKMKLPHIVPLSDYAISLLRQLQIITGSGEYMFPNGQFRKNPYISENVINNVIDETTFKDKLVGHGFRSLASTTLNEHGFNKDAIERQLAHKEPNRIRAAYNHAEYILERKEMMQWWSDFIKKHCYASIK